MVVSLPTIESSYSSHITKGIQGFTHAERPALVVAGFILVTIFVAGLGVIAAVVRSDAAVGSPLRGGR